MKIISHYHIDSRNHVICDFEITCPCCNNAALRHKDYTDRTVREPAAVRIVFYLERRRCPNCNTEHTLVPDFLPPKGCYTIKTMREAVFEHRFTSDYPYECPDPKTIRRWCKAYEEGRLNLDIEVHYVIEHDNVFLFYPP